MGSLPQLGIQDFIVTWCWWLTPVIVTTQEAEIRSKRSGGLSFKASPRQIVHKNLSGGGGGEGLRRVSASQERAGGVA
jgi:hypothetical protein